MPQTSGSRVQIFAALVVCLTGTWLVAQTRVEQEARREQWQRVGEIFQAMGVRYGATVADVGAGSGFFTSRLAAAVGPTGHVYSVDVSDSALERLRRRVTDEGHRNVTIIKGTASNPLLPAAALDAALIVNAYHEMTEHQAMLSAIRAALKPTGRLVLVEPISDTRRTADRATLARHHEFTPELAMQEARAAGLHITGLQDPFTTHGGRVEWILTLTPSAIAAAVPTQETPSTAASERTDDEWRDPALRLSIDEFVALSTSRDVTIIDVRDEGMFTNGHIPGAVSIPLPDIESSAEKLRNFQQPFVTYCS